LRVDVLGVRGSTPAPGLEFARIGGHTSCVALAHDGRPPSLVLDAGTGLQRLGPLLGDAPFRGTILLGHLHWDHTHGLPFSRPVDRPDSQVRLLMPGQGDPVGVLERVMSPPHFPIGPTGLRGDWRFEGLEPGVHRIEDFTVLALEIPHKGGRTFGFRVDDGVSAVAYLSDHCPVSLGPGPDGLGPYHESALALADGVDLLFHDAQYTAEELPGRATFGHSAAGYAAGLGAASGAARVVLYHHDPGRTDDEVDALTAAVAAAAEVPVEAAVERTCHLLG